MVHSLIGHGERGVTVERCRAGEQLVGEDADGIHVAGRADVAGADLFWREVGRRAQYDTGGGDLGLRECADEPEVGDLDLAAVGDQNVLRLHVAVHQPLVVCHREAAEHRAEHRGDRVRRHRAALDKQFTQRAAVNQFHHQKRVLSVDALVVDRHQAGVLQLCDGAGLALEARQELAVTGIAGIHDLQCHRPIQPEIEPPVDAGHAAGGDQGVDAVAPVQHDPDERVGLLVGLHRKHGTEHFARDCGCRARTPTRRAS